MVDIGELKTLYLQGVGKYKQLQSELEKNKSKLVELENRNKLVIEAQAFLQKVAQTTQSKLKFQIEDIVNLALETCFPAEYDFGLNFTISRGKTEAELVFTDKKTGRQIDPMNASGGGVIDLTAFALRIASYALEQNLNNVIILDEPFRFISVDLQAKAGKVLKLLSDKMGLQIIMVTHSNTLINFADKIFEVKKIDGISTVREVENAD